MKEVLHLGWSLVRQKLNLLKRFQKILPKKPSLEKVALFTLFMVKKTIESWFSPACSREQTVQFTVQIQHCIYSVFEWLFLLAQFLLQKVAVNFDPVLQSVVLFNKTVVDILKVI